jgi:hypothetical protein
MSDPVGVARAALQRMSDHFQAKDVPGLIGSFCRAQAAAYAGSESGETALGPAALLSLLTGVLSRPVRYSFSFPEVAAGDAGTAVWVLADGLGHEHLDSGEAEEFPYRISGVLVPEDGEWRWALLTGAEPVPTSS